MNSVVGIPGSGTDPRATGRPARPLRPARGHGTGQRSTTYRIDIRCRALAPTRRGTRACSRVQLAALLEGANGQRQHPVAACRR